MSRPGNNRGRGGHECRNRRELYLPEPAENMRSSELGAAGAAAGALPRLPCVLSPRPGPLPRLAGALVTGPAPAPPFRSSARLEATRAPSSSLVESPRADFFAA